ncbi:barstar family protein [Kribbella deserti]|uniref:Barstar family protein n=1 Tax=Kribbella deserti TaxID=1926257 RepID=A0ABV6QKU3_9ACTN
MSVTELLAEGLPPGVYRWNSAEPAEAVEREAVEAGWTYTLLDTTGVLDKAGFLDTCATAFDLPRWFGRNWDALADSLGDRGTGEPELVLWEGWQHLLDADHDTVAVALQIFGEDAKESGQLRILMRLPGDAEVPCLLVGLPAV